MEIECEFCNNNNMNININITEDGLIIYDISCTECMQIIKTIEAKY